MSNIPKKRMTEEQKLSWLKQKNVVLKKEKLSPSTIKRLYSFYHRNPLSTPRNLAYGMPKRVQKAIEEEHIIRTPKGKLSAQRYIRNIDKRTFQRVQKQLPWNISTPKRSQRFKSGKREDRFRYSLRPDEQPSGLITSATNINDVMRLLQEFYIPDLMETIDLFYKKRRYFYKGRLVGALIYYDTENMPDDSRNYRPVAFTNKNQFAQYLWDMLHELLITDILRNYKDAIIQLKYFDIFIRTREQPTSVERLL